MRMTGVWIVLLYYGSYLLIGQFILIPTSHFHYFKLFPLKRFPFNEYTVTRSSCFFLFSNDYMQSCILPELSTETKNMTNKLSF